VGALRDAGDAMTGTIDRASVTDDVFAATNK
jgi:hypothetical protein